MESTEGRGDYSKKLRTPEGKNCTNIDTETGPLECSSGPVYYN